MAGETKMIIITSNEDLIRQFSLNKNINTHIIDLDNNQQIQSIEKDTNNVINLAVLSELSEFNSNSDNVYKRVLDSPQNNRSKSMKVAKKSIDLICSICGDRAIGFNYDVLSCASCKAFFRRNAHQQPGKLRCLTGQNQCSVSHLVRRKCQRCRLDRCFAVGMRKDFILSEEEKQRRKKRLEENRNNTLKHLSKSESINSLNILPNSESFSQTLDEIDQLLMDMDKDNNSIVHYESADSNEMEDLIIETLSVEDWVIIQSVQSSFISFFHLPTIQCGCIDLSDRTTALISWSQFANQIALRFINFFRHIDEFENLHFDDRFILIKYNLLPLFPISKCYNYQPTNDCCNIGNSEEAERHRRFFLLCEAPIDVRESFVNLVQSLVKTTEQDPGLLSLLLIILLFSQGLSMSKDEPSLKDPVAVYRAQSHYTKVLWNYMVNKQGEMKSYKQFIELMTIIFKTQSATKRGREFFRNQLMTLNTIDRIAPLMQTVLQIS